ncbi:MAG: hypothetical protein OXC37_03280, partial [Bdellovibrionaceae bacterium]|nr:hypothetical protein [Pseudobdellovibrionaceae bacterium]
MKQIVLKNNLGEIIRVFRCQTEKIFLVYRKNKGRLDLCSSPHFFEKESVILVDEWQTDKLNKQKVPFMGGTLESCDKIENVRVDLPIPNYKNLNFGIVFGWTAGSYLTLMLG